MDLLVSLIFFLAALWVAKAIASNFGPFATANA